MYLFNFSSSDSLLDESLAEAEASLLKSFARAEASLPGSAEGEACTGSDAAADCCEPETAELLAEGGVSEVLAVSSLSFY